MKLWKGFGFWLPVLSFAVCLHHLLGYDDKNLLLFLTNPLLLMLNPQLTHLHDSMSSELLWQWVLYGIHFCSWLLLGMLVDWAIIRFKSK